MNCKVKTAFSRYVTRITKIYNETNDVYRCGKLQFKTPKCNCEECMKKGSSLWSSSPEEWEKLDLGLSEVEIHKVLDKHLSEFKNDELKIVEIQLVSKTEYDLLKSKLKLAVYQRNYLIDNYYNEKNLTDRKAHFDAELAAITAESKGEV